MNERIETLALVRLTCWQMLERACGEPDHDWRALTLATIAGSGVEARADARTVILREVDPAARTLVFYTDSRSPKVAQIRHHPLATLLAWSARARWQLRLHCRLKVHSDRLAVSSRWARLRMTSAARDYLSPLPPGAPLETDWSPLAPQHATPESFAFVIAAVDTIDWLELHPDGHRRAIFDARGERWVNP